MHTHSRKARKARPALCLAVLVACAAFAAGALAAPPPDIEGHWAEHHIREWLEKGLAAGYEDGTFRPEDPVSRAEFAAFVNRSFGFEEREAHGFPDIPGDAWYAPHVEKAAAAGYLSGYEDGTFRPQRAIARQEVAKVLHSLLDLPDPEEDPLEDLADAEEVAGWSRAPVRAALHAGLMHSYPDGNFRPAAAMTRAECVAALDAAYKMKEDKLEEYFALTFLVQDAEGEPLEGAAVLLDAVELASGEDGTAAFEVEPGTYDYTVQKEGYVTQMGRVEVADEDVEVQVVMEAPAAALTLDKEQYYADEAVALVVENTGFTDIQLGYPFAVQKLRNDTWTDVELDIAWILVLVSLKPGETLEQEFTPAEDFQEEPAAGEYRVQKEVECLDTGVRLTLSAGFELLE